MPGGHRVNYDFPRGTPKPLSAAFILFFSNFVLNFSLGLWADYYAPRQASAYYSYPIRFKGGLVVYVPPALGNYLVWGFWSHFLLLGIIWFLFWYYEKTGRAVRVH